jgi:hypothetical protein
MQKRQSHPSEGIHQHFPNLGLPSTSQHKQSHPLDRPRVLDQCSSSHSRELYQRALDMSDSIKFEGNHLHLRCESL